MSFAAMEEQDDQILESEGNTMSNLMRLVIWLFGAALVVKGLARLSLLGGG